MSNTVYHSQGSVTRDAARVAPLCHHDCADRACRELPSSRYYEDSFICYFPISLLKYSPSSLQPNS